MGDTLRSVSAESLTSLGHAKSDVHIGAYNPSTRRWKLCIEEEQTGSELPPTWVNARWLRKHGPADLCPPGYDRSVNDALLAKYVQTATAGRAWFLRTAGPGLVQRWHAKSVAESDFGAVRDKHCCGSAQQHMCECGEAVETADHVYLECSLCRDFRAKMAPFVTRWTQAVAALPPGQAPTRPIRDLRDVMHWVHHDTPLVNDPLLGHLAQETRQAALAFHSGILHERYVTGRTSRAPHNEPDFLVAQDTTDLLHATPGGH